MCHSIRGGCKSSSSRRGTRGPVAPAKLGWATFLLFHSFSSFFFFKSVSARRIGCVTQPAVRFCKRKLVLASSRGAHFGSVGEEDEPPLTGGGAPLEKSAERRLLFHPLSGKDAGIWHGGSAPVGGQPVSAGMLAGWTLPAKTARTRTSQRTGKETKTVEGSQVTASQKYSLLPSHVLLVSHIPVCAECGAISGGKGDSRAVP